MRLTQDLEADIPSNIKFDLVINSLISFVWGLFEKLGELRSMLGNRSASGPFTPSQELSRNSSQDKWQLGVCHVKNREQHQTRYNRILVPVRTSFGLRRCGRKTRPSVSVATDKNQQETSPFNMKNIPNTLINTLKYHRVFLGCLMYHRTHA